MNMKAVKSDYSLDISPRVVKSIRSGIKIVFIKNYKKSSRFEVGKTYKLCEWMPRAKRYSGKVFFTKLTRTVSSGRNVTLTFELISGRSPSGNPMRGIKIDEN